MVAFIALCPSSPRAAHGAVQRTSTPGSKKACYSCAAIPFTRGRKHHILQNRNMTGEGRAHIMS
jgi:hypothetical protein